MSSGRIGRMVVMSIGRVVLDLVELRREQMRKVRVVVGLVELRKEQMRKGRVVVGLVVERREQMRRGRGVIGGLVAPRRGRVVIGLGVGRSCNCNPMGCSVGILTCLFLLDDYTDRFSIFVSSVNRLYYESQSRVNGLRRGFPLSASRESGKFCSAGFLLKLLE